MEAEGRAIVAAALVGSLLAGCLGTAPSPLTEPPFPTGEHPWPRGDEWPPGLQGPFELGELLHAPVASFDDVVLDGWLYFPKVPAGTRLPVVLWSSPYFGQTGPTADDPRVRDNSGIGDAVPVDLLVGQGYAVALYSVRGTGNSGGCFGMFGPDEQRDQAALVEWLATQEWSSGRVGMMGLSYHGTTPWEAAIQAPPSLKTIVVAGMVGDLYTFYHTPQGAGFYWPVGPVFQTEVDALVSFLPPILGMGVDDAIARPERWSLDHAPVVPERACPEVVQTITALATEVALDQRDQAFWDERRLIDQFGDVTTAVLLTHGFQDAWGSGHEAQEDVAWAALRQAPKHLLEGQWGHQFPNFNTVHEGWELHDWNATLLRWLDFWLKGLGAPPEGLGRADFQDGTGAWHASTAWPPAEARDEALYLGAQLTEESGRDAFRAVPSFEQTDYDALCPDAPVPELQPRRLLFATEPLEASVTLAGNPWALLTLTSDQPGGLLGLYFYDLGPGFRCVEGAIQDARILSVGAADLRFLEGNFAARDFPVGQPTAVRVDLINLAEVVPAGHRLGLALAHGFHALRGSQPYLPSLALDVAGAGEASHLVVPLLQGSLGGAPPLASYPQRPFAGLPPKPME